MDPVHLNKLFSKSNWWFLIPCYYQNLRGDFEKHPLFQHSSTIAILFRASLFLLCRNLSISGTNSRILLDPRIREQEPKKLTVKRKQEEEKKLIELVNSPATAPKTWWVKLQVHGSTEVVKREYRSNRVLFNSINFYWWLEESSVVKIGFLTV